MLKVFRNKNGKSLNFLAAFVACCLLAAVAIAFCFVATHLEHDCSHERDCPVCAQLAVCSNLLENVSAGAAAAVLGFLLFARMFAAAPDENAFVARWSRKEFQALLKIGHPSLVALGVQSNA